MCYRSKQITVSEGKPVTSYIVYRFVKRDCCVRGYEIGNTKTCRKNFRRSMRSTAGQCPKEPSALRHSSCCNRCEPCHLLSSRRHHAFTLTRNCWLRVSGVVVQKPNSPQNSKLAGTRKQITSDTSAGCRCSRSTYRVHTSDSCQEQRQRFSIKKVTGTSNDVHGCIVSYRLVRAFYTSSSIRKTVEYRSSSICGESTSQYLSWLTLNNIQLQLTDNVSRWINVGRKADRPESFVDGLVMIISNCMAAFWIRTFHTAFEWN